MTIHISLDLETWGKKPGCDIRSIGACVFDPTSGAVCGYNDVHLPGIKTFYIATENPHRSGLIDEFLSIHPGIETTEDRKYPLIRDPETVKWWNDQTPEAQAAFVNPVDLRNACLQFGKWLYALTDTAWYPEHHLHGFENVHVWANGPQFDVSILEAVYHAVDLPVPWHYRAPRDFRTITMDAAGMTYDEFSTYGEPHHALHDAIAQAMTICEAFKRIGKQR